MAEPKAPQKTTTDETPADRYRYIGFEVYPEKVETFWKSDTEEKEYESRLRDELGSSTLHRDFSLLEQEAMGKADHWVLAATAAVMILTVAMPWVSYRTSAGTDFSMSWPGALGTLFGSLGTAFSAGMAVGLSALLGLVVMIGAPLIGAWGLAMIWRKAKTPEAYFAGLRQPLRLGYILVFSGLAVIVLAFVGGQIPSMSSWGLIDPPDSYGIGVLFKILSMGGYLAMATGMIFGVKSGDL
jgi:hypothetical protein